MKTLNQIYRKNILQLLITMFVISLSSCAALHSVSMTPVPKVKKKTVKVELTNWAFLGIHFSNDFVDELPEQLKAQCPNGRITGLMTKFSTKWYVLVQNRIVESVGYCEDAGS